MNLKIFKGEFEIWVRDKEEALTYVREHVECHKKDKTCQRLYRRQIKKIETSAPTFLQVNPGELLPLLLHM